MHDRPDKVAYRCNFFPPTLPQQPGLSCCWSNSVNFVEGGCWFPCVVGNLLWLTVSNRHRAYSMPGERAIYHQQLM